MFLGGCQKLHGMNVSFTLFAFRNLIGEVPVLEDMTSHLPLIEIRIEECRGNDFNSWLVMFLCSGKVTFYSDTITWIWFSLVSADEGIDVRIRGLKIKSSCERDLGLNADIFQSTNLVRYPRLQGHSPDFLYGRAKVTHRYLTIHDLIKRLLSMTVGAGSVAQPTALFQGCHIDSLQVSQACLNHI